MIVNGCIKCNAPAYLDVLVHSDYKIPRKFLVRCMDDQECGNMTAFHDKPKDAIEQWNNQKCD